MYASSEISTRYTDNIQHLVCTVIEFQAKYLSALNEAVVEQMGSTQKFRLYSNR